MSVANRPLQTIERSTSAEVIAKFFPVAFPDAPTVLDATYGSGMFWKGTTLDVGLTGLDINQTRAPHVVGDFRALPFADDSVDVVIFDPPCHTDMGRGKASVMGARFDIFATITELRAAVEQGTREAWRVARLGIIVKVMDHNHANRVQWMSVWVKAALRPDGCLRRRAHRGANQDHQPEVDHAPAAVSPVGQHHVLVLPSRWTAA